MIEKSHTDQLESIIALNMALGGNLSKDLTSQESERNIAENLVQVCVKYDTYESIGTGFMITTNGFVLTAYHNIQKVEEEWKRILISDPVTEENVNSWINRIKDRFCIIDQKGNKYPIDIYAHCSVPVCDIALIKAITQARPKPTRFKVTSDPLQVGDEVKLFGIRDHQPFNQLGKVIHDKYDAQITDQDGKESSTIYDTFMTDAYGVPGFSGGVFTDLYGGFAGLTLYIQKDKSKEIGMAGGAKVNNIVKMIQEMSYTLGKIQLETNQQIFKTLK